MSAFQHWLQETAIDCCPPNTHVAHSVSVLQMSKAEKAQQKKQKAQQFSGQSQKKVSKNQGRWN